MAAVFNVRVETPRGSVPSTVRKCAVPTDHLCAGLTIVANVAISTGPALLEAPLSSVKVVP